MINNQAASPTLLWQQTAARAAAEARWLGLVATVLFAIATLLIATEYFVLPVWKIINNPPLPSASQALRQILFPWVYAGTAISLTWALWEARLYLRRLEQGEFWVASTMAFWERIGECLLVGGIWTVLVAPTVHMWVSGRHGGFDSNPNAASLVLLGLGLFLTVMARVLSQVLSTAEGLKADNDLVV